MTGKHSTEKYTWPGLSFCGHQRPLERKDRESSAVRFMLGHLLFFIYGCPSLTAILDDSLIDSPHMWAPRQHSYLCPHAVESMVPWLGAYVPSATAPSLGTSLSFFNNRPTKEKCGRLLEEWKERPPDAVASFSSQWLQRLCLSPTDVW